MDIGITLNVSFIQIILVLVGIYYRIKSRNKRLFPPPYLWHISHQYQGVQDIFSTRILVRRGQGVILMVKGEVVNRFS